MIRVLLIELHKAEAECILRSVTSELGSDTEVSREVEIGAGEGVSDRLEAMGRLPVGAAVITQGGDLHVSFLIHVVLQAPDEPVRKEGLRLALQNGLRRAQEWGMETLAMPVLGVGAGNLSAEDSAEVMVPMIQDHLLRFDHPGEVIVAVSSEYEEDVFHRAVELAERQSSALEN
jgi:O-acetyl-ADP-ribose deacetylase (regulator of RNase III)